MEGLRLGGRRVPEDVSIVGYDDLPECQYTHPRLTSISQHLEEKALCAGKALFSMLRNKPAARHQTVDVELIERQSVIDLTQ
jgi:LacI family transcriptional regulator